MTIQVVNGFVCLDCADVALAKKDINPAHPPGSPNAVPPSGSSNSQGAPAITFGGSLSQLPGANAVQQPGGTSPSQLNPDQTNPTPPGQPPTAQSSTGQTPSPQPYNPQNGEKLSVFA
jgi:hypothetical protein